MARDLGSVRVTDTIREPIRSAIRRGLLGYERDRIGRVDGTTDPGVEWTHLLP
jgi:hypothetical protein